MNISEKKKIWNIISYLVNEAMHWDIIWIRYEQYFEWLREKQDEGVVDTKLFSIHI